MTILCYHSIDAEWEDPLAVRPGDFARQMRIVASMAPLPLPEYVAKARRRALPRGAVAVTFDDGYANALCVALPVCRELGLCPAIFLAAGHIDSGEPLGWLPGIPEAGNAPLTWEDVRELASNGWTVGSHTTGHGNLVLLSGDERQRELAGSKARIEEMLGVPCDTIAYPYGRHDEDVRSATAAAGYDAAFTLPTGREFHDLGMAIPRIGVYREDNMGLFRLKLWPLTVTMKLALSKARPIRGSGEETSP